MKTIEVHLFTIKDKEDGKRYLMKLTGNCKSMKEFKDAFDDAEYFDFRTVRWLNSHEEVSNFTGVNVEPIYDSQDEPFYEAITG